MDNQEHSYPSDMSGRVSRIEAQITSLTSAVSGLAASTTGLADDVKQTNESLRNFARDTHAAMAEIGSQQGENQKTPWGTLASWAGVLLAIGGVFGSILGTRIDSIVQRQDRFEVLNERSAYEDGRRDELDRWLIEGHTLEKTKD